MLRVTDASGVVHEITGPAVGVAAQDLDLGTVLAVDTLRRTAQVLGKRPRVIGLPDTWPELNIAPGDDPGPADVVLHRPWPTSGPPYALGHRLSWLGGSDVAEASEELTRWRSLVADWAEDASRPMCAQVQEDLLAAMCDDLDTRTAVRVLRSSLELELPSGCLFETWAWADRMLALDLTADVGR